MTYFWISLYRTFPGDSLWVNSQLFVSLKNHSENQNEVKVSKYKSSEKTMSGKKKKREWITKGNYFSFLAFCSILKIIQPLIIVKFVAAVLFTHWMSQGSKATEKNDGVCIRNANMKFVSLAGNILTSDMFYTKINNLKCLYVSIYRNKTYCCMATFLHC